jgi:hypothetical protein
MGSFVVALIAAAIQCSGQRLSSHAATHSPELGDHDATTIFTQALHDLDPTFTRAEAVLHTDLANIHTKHGDYEHASYHNGQAHGLPAPTHAATTLRS